MLDYADLDLECLERRSRYAQLKRDFVPTQYLDIDFSRSSETDRCLNRLASRGGAKESEHSDTDC